MAKAEKTLKYHYDFLEGQKAETQKESVEATYHCDFCGWDGPMAALNPREKCPQCFEKAKLISSTNVDDPVDVKESTKKINHMLESVTRKPSPLTESAVAEKPRNMLAIDVEQTKSCMCGACGWLAPKGLKESAKKCPNCGGKTKPLI